MSNNEISINELWKSSCVLLKKQSLATYEQWFHNIVPVDITNNIFLLGVGDDFYADFLQDHYIDLITDSINSIYDTNYKISFKVGEEFIPNNESIAFDDTSDELDDLDDISNPPEKIIPKNCHSDHTFYNFIVGEYNKIAYAAALNVAKTPGKLYNPLFIYGNTGLGKTHILQAIAHKYTQTHTKASVEYVTCEELMNLYVDSLRTRKHYTFRDRFRAADILLVDDIHFLAKGEKLQEEFFNIFNTLYNGGKQIVLSSDRQPCDINGLEDRLVSRFEHGLTTEILTPSFETRLAILKQYQASQPVKLSEELLHFVALRISSNVRSLQGALIRLIAYNTLGEDITIEIAESLLGRLIDEQVIARQVTIETIQKVVASHYDMRVSDITGKRRPSDIALARQVSMYLSREITDLSFPQIAREFGGRNHATVLHGHRKITNDICNNEILRRTVSILKQKIQNA